MFKRQSYFICIVVLVNDTEANATLARATCNRRFPFSWSTPLSRPIIYTSSLAQDIFAQHGAVTFSMVTWLAYNSLKLLIHHSTSLPSHRMSGLEPSRHTWRWFRSPLQIPFPILLHYFPDKRVTLDIW